MIHRCMFTLMLALLISAEALGRDGAVDPDQPLNWAERLQRAIGDPTLVFILLMIGLSGITAEFSHPGAWFPGITGVVCLLLACFGMRVLPINFFGLALIILGVLMVLLEVKVHSAGV